MIIALTVGLAVLVGVALGMLGGGGSILTVPLLAYVAGMPAKEAIATSLLVVAVTSAVAAVSHARAGRVRWRTGLLFGGAAMVGAYTGGRLGVLVPGTVLLIGFAVLMLATAVAMIRGRRAASTTPARHDLPVLLVLGEGVVVGLVTGMVGAGGGFLVVPALALLGGLPMPAAVGTSLVVIALKSTAGLAGYLADVRIDWGVALAVTAAAVVGAVIGERLSGRVHADDLRRGFGWFVVVMGVFVLGQELERLLAEPSRLMTGLILLAALAVGATAWLITRLLGRRRPEPRMVPA